MIEDIKSAIDRLNSTFQFYGSCDINKLDPSDYTAGTIVYDPEKQCTYACINNSWEPVGYEDQEEKIEEIKEVKCRCCGAPIKVRHKYENVQCEYCGQTYYTI